MLIENKIGISYFFEIRYDYCNQIIKEKQDFGISLNYIHPIIVIDKKFLYEK
jgi:hypothetical protein